MDLELVTFSVEEHLEILSRFHFLYKNPGKFGTCFVFCIRVLGNLEHVTSSIEEVFETLNMLYPFVENLDLDLVVFSREELLEVWNM